MDTLAEKLYEEWCGVDRHVNDCVPVHDSTATIEFAEYYHKALTEEKVRQCPECGSPEIKMFTADNDICWNCHKILPGE